MYLERSELTYTATVCTSCIGMPSQAKGMRYKQLLSKAIPYAGGTNSCFLNKLPTLEVQRVAF